MEQFGQMTRGGNRLSREAIVADQDVIQGLMQVLPGFEGNIPHMYLDTAGLVTGEYFLDHQLIAHVEKIGIPLDKRESRSPASIPRLATGSWSPVSWTLCVSGTGYSRSWTRSRFSTQKH